MSGISKAERERRVREAEAKHTRNLLDMSGMDAVQELANQDQLVRDHHEVMFLPDSLQRRIKDDQAGLDKWASKDFANNPDYAMEWADGVAEAAARISAYKEFLEAYFAKGPAWAFEWAERKVLNLASHRCKSTSSCSTLMAQCRLEAWARLLDERKWLTGRLF
jgi:hypothetical protein